MIHRNETITTAREALPIRLEVTLDIRRLAALFGGMLLSIVVFAVGGWLAAAGMTDVQFRTSGEWLLLIGGVLVLVASMTVFVSLLNVFRSDVRHDNAIKHMRLEFGKVELTQRAEGRAVMQQTNIKTYEYGPVIEPAKVFLAAAWLLLYGPSRPSAIQLAGASLMWRIGSSERELLRFSSEESAGRFLTMVADAGLIEGRGPRRAGALVPADLETAMERIGRAMLRAERGGD